MADENTTSPQENQEQQPQAETAPVVIAATNNENTAPQVETEEKERGTTITVVESKPQPSKNRDTKSVNFNLEEKDYIEAAIAARVTHNLSNNAGHFIRQCIDIAMNADYHVLNGREYRFAISENPIEKKFLKDAFFSAHPHSTDYKTIK